MDKFTPTSVYKYFDKYDCLIYVGITSRGMKRQAEHNKTKDWWGFVVRQDVEHYETRSEALARESQMIAIHTPPFNTQQNPLHVQVQRTYLSCLALLDQCGDPQQLLRDSGRTIPLLVISQSLTRVILSTNLTMVPVTARMTVGDDVKAVVGTTKCGHVIGTYRRGFFTQIEVEKRAGAPVVEPFGRIQTQVGIDVTFSLKNIQLAA